MSTRKESHRHHRSLLLNLVHDPKTFGRGVVAAQDLPCGTLIQSVTPYAFATKSECDDTHCALCGEKLSCCSDGSVCAASGSDVNVTEPVMTCRRRAPLSCLGGCPLKFCSPSCRETFSPAHTSPVTAECLILQVLERYLQQNPTSVAGELTEYLRGVSLVLYRFLNFDVDDKRRCSSPGHDEKEATGTQQHHPSDHKEDNFLNKLSHAGHHTSPIADTCTGAGDSCGDKRQDGGGIHQLPPSVIGHRQDMDTTRCGRILDTLLLKKEGAGSGSGSGSEEDSLCDYVFDSVCERRGNSAVGDDCCDVAERWPLHPCDLWGYRWAPADENSARAKEAVDNELVASLTTNLSLISLQDRLRYRALYQLYVSCVRAQGDILRELRKERELPVFVSSTKAKSEGEDEGVLPMCSMDVWIHVCMAIQSNGFGVIRDSGGGDENDDREEGNTRPDEAGVSSKHPGAAPSATTRRQVGLALFPSASFFNHSCVPNVLRVTRGRAMYFYVNRDVKKGEALCISYILTMRPSTTTAGARAVEPSPGRTQMPRKTSPQEGEMIPFELRQEKLKGTYCFACCCPLCSEELECLAHRGVTPDASGAVKKFRPRRQCTRRRTGISQGTDTPPGVQQQQQQSTPLSLERFEYYRSLLSRSIPRCPFCLDASLQPMSLSEGVLHLCAVGNDSKGTDSKNVLPSPSSLPFPRPQREDGGHAEDGEGEGDSPSPSVSLLCGSCRRFSPLTGVVLQMLMPRA